MAAACSGDDGSSSSTEPTEPSSSETTSTTAPEPGPWEEVVPGGECQCADGGEFSFFARPADPNKVVLFLQGGGACFSAATCDYTAGEGVTYDFSVGPEDSPEAHRAGIFDFANPDNPFTDHSFVFVPYCTGDVHIGNATTDYTPELTISHKGAVNGNAAVAYLADHFPDADQVVVVGESAGAVAAPLYGGLVTDALPGAQVTVLADSAGAYPDVPALNQGIGALWGTMDAIPDWPVNEGMTAERWSLPGLWVQAGRHAPDLVMARFDFAYDGIQAFFAGLAGIDAADLLSFMDDNEARVEAAGIDQHSFTAGGSDHTLVRRPGFYTTEVDGTRLVDWVADLVSGEPVPDVRCTECRQPAG